MAKILFFGSAESPREDTCTDEMQMARHLVDAGNEVILCSDHEVCNEFRRKKQTIMVIPDLKSGKVENGVIERISAYDFDVAFASSLAYAPAAIFFARRKSVPSVVQILDIPLWRFGLDPKSEWWAAILPMLVDYVDVIIVNTKVTEDILIKMGVPKDKITRIYIGVNLRAVGKGTGMMTHHAICCVSRNVFHKALELGLFAFAMSNANTTLKLIGHGEEQMRLELLADMMNLNVKFLGFVSERIKIQEISSSLFGIYPDICPTIGGLFPLESLACGRPCIVWDMGVHRDRYGDCVEYVPLYDVKAFADKMNYLLDNPSYREERGEIGKEWVLKNRTYKLHAEKLTEVLSKLC